MYALKTGSEDEGGATAPQESQLIRKRGEQGVLWYLYASKILGDTRADDSPLRVQINA